MVVSPSISFLSAQPSPAGPSVLTVHWNAGLSQYEWNFDTVIATMPGTPTGLKVAAANPSDNNGFSGMQADLIYGATGAGQPWSVVPVVSGITFVGGGSLASQTGTTT